MKHYIYILLTISLLSSCSEYQKVLKNEDIAAKFKMGEALYNEGKYAKASKLFAQIVPSYRGKPQAEKLMYLYAQSYYKTGDYLTSGYQFERFASSYPKSEKLEEASFLSAKSYYKLCPMYSKDQTETKKAIEKLQSFINLFRNSEYMPEANELVKELEFRLEKKAFEIAKQYVDIAPGYTKDFKAGIKSFDNFIYEFPGSSLREDALYYRFKAAYEQAINSVEYKRPMRLNMAKDYYKGFKEKYADSEYLDELDSMAETLTQELKKYNTES